MTCMTIGILCRLCGDYQELLAISIVSIKEPTTAHQTKIWIPFKQSSYNALVSYSSLWASLYSSLKFTYKQWTASLNSFFFSFISTHYLWLIWTHFWGVPSISHDHFSQILNSAASCSVWLTKHRASSKTQWQVSEICLVSTLLCLWYGKLVQMVVSLSAGGFRYNQPKLQTNL